MIFDDQFYNFNGREFSSDEAFILFLIPFEKYFQNLYLCSRLSPGSKKATYAIPQHKIEVCALPYYKNVTGLLANAFILLPRIWGIVKKSIHNWDVLWLTWPHPISLLMLIKARRSNKLCFLVVRQNLKELVKQRYSGIKKLAALLVVNSLEWLLKLMAKDVIIFTVGGEMYQKFRRCYSHVHQIEISLLSKNILPNYFPLSSCDFHVPLRLLFVGRLDPEKGLKYLFHALAMLKEQNQKVHLDIVGSGPEENNLQKLTQELYLNEWVSFHGYIPFGEALFYCYQNTDLLVLPSLSEGIPQVLLEAMAIGVPIITTRIPSMKGFISHKENGWLVAPGSAATLTKAIMQLANNPIIVESMVKRSREGFYRHTMEFQHEKILKLLVNYME